jgi:hypothetical protein
MSLLAKVLPRLSSWLQVACSGCLEKSCFLLDLMIDARFQQFRVRHVDCLEEELKYFPRFNARYIFPVNLLIMFKQGKTWAQ